MRKEFFQNLGDKENGKFRFHDKDVSIGFGVRSPNVVYQVTFDYKGNSFFVENTTGTNFVAEISCILDTSIKPIEFELFTISHFKNLFFRKNSRFQIKTDNENLRYFLNHNENFKKLEEISVADKFDPSIQIVDGNPSKMIARYHLEMDEWTDPIEPMIELFKDLIDEYEKGLSHVEHKNYIANFEKQRNANNV